MSESGAPKFGAPGQGVLIENGFLLDKGVPETSNRGRIFVTRRQLEEL